MYNAHDLIFQLAQRYEFQQKKSWNEILKKIRTLQPTQSIFSLMFSHISFQRKHMKKGYNRIDRVLWLPLLFFPTAILYTVLVCANPDCVRALLLLLGVISLPPLYLDMLTFDAINQSNSLDVLTVNAWMLNTKIGIRFRKRKPCFPCCQTRVVFVWQIPNTYMHVRLYSASLQ